MLGDYRFVVEMDLVVDMADEFERLYGLNDVADALIEALMDIPESRFDSVLLNVEDDTAYFVVMPPKKWTEGIAMARKLARV